MATNYNLAMGLTLLIATTFLLAESSVTTVTSFDNYIGVVDKLTLVSDRLRVLEAVWGEIRANGTGNLTRIKQFYDTVESKTVSVKIEETEEASELLVEVRDILITENGRLLAETLNNNKSQTVLQVANFRRQLLDTYKEELLYSIFEHAIDTLFPLTATDLLWESLNTVGSTTFSSAQRVFNVKVHWNLYLYWKFQARGEINDAYVYIAAQTLHNFKRDALYKNLLSNPQRRIDTAYDNFTPSLRHLFNTTRICLLNENFANYYLYFSSATAGGSTLVQAVIRNIFSGYSVWRNSYGAQTTPVTGNFYLTTPNVDWYLYRRTTDYAVVVQRSDNLASNRYWTPSLRDKNIMFQDNGYYMCATSDYVGTLMGFAVKAIKTQSLDDKNCQWTLTNCSELGA